MQYTIGSLARKFQLSRSTLLYYDSIGLLSPPERSEGNYRLYSESDCRRLEQIMLYRRAGLPLEHIREILSGAPCAAASRLEEKIAAISREIQFLRQQQQCICELLQQPSGRLWEQAGLMSKEELVAWLRSAGMDDQAQWRLHHQMESSFPEKHEAFLQFLGLTAEQIAHIREWSRSDPAG